MKIVITEEFDNLIAASEFLVRAYGQHPIALTPPPSAPIGNQQSKPEKPARKPRSDAGKPRGEYKPRATTTGEPAASEPGVQGQDSAVAPLPAAPATPTQSSAPAPTGSDEKSVTRDVPAAEGSNPNFPATLEGARAAMKRLNDAPGKGMDACIGALKAHGVNRISDLPKEKYAAFIEYVVGQLPK